MPKRPLLPLTLALLALAGCSSKEADPAPTCEDRAKTAGVCPGVTEDAVSTDGVACTTKIDVTPGDLASKASSAAGTCLVLGSGDYPAVTLAAGVSLIGKGAAATSIEGITTTGADAGATIRGVRVGAGGIVVSGKGTLVVDRVLVSGAALYGVAATGTSLKLSASTIENTGSFGVYSLCKKDCLPARTQLSLERVRVQKAKTVGVWVHGGVDVTIDGAQIDHTDTSSFLYGRGLEVAEGATLDARRLACVDNADVGVLVDGGSAQFDGLTSSRNMRGVQLQGLGAGKLVNFEVMGNDALGVGIARGTKGLIVQGGLVASTKKMSIPVDVGGVKEVGDGINWIEGSEVDIAESVKIQGSARRPVIIDSTSKGKFAGTLGGGDEVVGLIVQGGLEPSMPAGLTVVAGVKTEMLTKEKAMPVAMTVDMTKAP